MTLGPGREFDLIRRLLAAWGGNASGVGDDAALLQLPAGDQLVVSTDTSLEDVHFRREWLTLGEIGYRATMAALSDLAATAAVPMGVLVAASLPPDVADVVEDLAAGIGEAVGATGCTVIGGDLTRGAALSLTITVLGRAERPVTRRGARPGHFLYLTGELGGPGAALRSWREGTQPAAAFRARFARPRARLEEARWLAARGASAMIDLSDGLSSDAWHLAAASGVTLSLDLGRVRCLSGVAPRQAAASGEEYELLVAVPDELDARAFTARFGIPVTRVGSVVSEDAADVRFEEAGKRVDLGGGYDHFSV